VLQVAACQQNEQAEDAASSPFELKHAGFLLLSRRGVCILLTLQQIRLVRWSSRQGSRGLADSSSWFCLVLGLLNLVARLVLLILLVVCLILLCAVPGLVFFLLLFLLVLLLYTLDLLFELPLPACLDGSLVNLGRAKAGVLEMGRANVEPILCNVRAQLCDTDEGSSGRTLLSGVISTLELSLKQMSHDLALVSATLRCA
jgi:hypothetical protein